MSFNKKRGMRKAKKKGANESRLMTQENYYIEATQQEEQAERWTLSDIKKTLRHYIQAYELYNQALNCNIDATDAGRYNVLYNQTRLTLVVYTEYLAVNGYINVLAYLSNLEELSGLDSIILTLPLIVAKLEAVLQEFRNNSAVTNFWDLKFNLLTCYLMMAESVNHGGSGSKRVNASGEDVIELVQDKFIPCFKELESDIITSLNDWNEILQSTKQQDPAHEEYHIGSQDQQTSDVGREYGDKTDQHDGGNNETGFMEVSDQVTPETLSEIYVIAYKFMESVMELLIDARCKPQQAVLNLPQSNYLEDTVKQFVDQLDERVINLKSQYTVDTSEITLCALSLTGTRLVLEGNTEPKMIEQFLSTRISTVSNHTGVDIDTKLLMVKSDIYELVVSVLEENLEDSNVTVYEQLWAVSSALGKALGAVSKTLNDKRTSLISGKLRSQGEQLSSTVFSQCDVIINSADNELLRAWVLECKDTLTGTQAASAKTVQILRKNAGTLLTNAMKIAEKPCGLEECIVDKLKRNYIYNQARGRSALLTGATLPQTPTTADLLDQISDHPFYRQIIE